MLCDWLIDCVSEWMIDSLSDWLIDRLSSNDYLIDERLNTKNHSITLSDSKFSLVYTIRDQSWNSFLKHKKLEIKKRQLVVWMKRVDDFWKEFCDTFDQRLRSEELDRNCCEYRCRWSVTWLQNDKERSNDIFSRWHLIKIKSKR